MKESNCVNQREASPILYKPSPLAGEGVAQRREREVRREVFRLILTLSSKIKWSVTEIPPKYHNRFAARFIADRTTATSADIFFGHCNFPAGILIGFAKAQAIFGLAKTSMLSPVSRKDFRLERAIGQPLLMPLGMAQASAVHHITVICRILHRSLCVHKSPPFLGNMIKRRGCCLRNFRPSPYRSICLHRIVSEKVEHNCIAKFRFFDQESV